MSMRRGNYRNSGEWQSAFISKNIQCFQWNICACSRACARSNNHGTPFDPERPRKGSKWGRLSPRHQRCVGCEIQTPQGVENRISSAHPRSVESPATTTACRPARRLSAVLPTLPASEPGSVTRRVLGVPQRWGARDAPVATETNGRDRNVASKTKITEARARAFVPADGREAVLWDSAAPGLGLRARPNGRKTWIVHRRWNGSVVKRTLGALDALTVEDARHAARALLADAQEKHAPAAVSTVRSFAPAFLADCAERWKPATRENYAHTVRRFILPAFGDRRVDAIGAKDVRNWFDDLAVTHHGSANWALAAMSSMMKHAEALGLRREDSNPCKGLRRRKTGFEAHYLMDDEFAALGRALDDAEAEWPVAVAVVRFLLYTGARKSEALRLKWEHVHGDRAVLSDSKTGPRTIWLASPARAILAAQSRRTNCPWVFASPCGGPVSVDKAWNAIRAAAGLPTLRIHDLRHSLAAVAVNGGEGLRVVAGLLGHADIKTTFGYAHLAEGSVFDAANRVSRGLADMLDGGEAGR